MRQFMLIAHQRLTYSAQSAVRSVGFGAQSPQRTKCKQYIIAICALVTLSACSETFFSHKHLGKPDFVGSPYVFNASRISVVRSKPVPNSDVQIRYRFPTTLDDGIQLWTMQRFRTPNGENYLHVDISDATVTEEEEVKTSFWSWLSGEEVVYHYHATLDVALKLYTPRSTIPSIVTEFKTERRITLDDGESEAARQRAFNGMVLSMLKEMDDRFSFMIPQRFTAFLYAQ